MPQSTVLLLFTWPRHDHCWTGRKGKDRTDQKQQRMKPIKEKDKPFIQLLLPLTDALKLAISCVNSLVLAQSDMHRLFWHKLNMDDASELPARVGKTKWRSQHPVTFSTFSKYEAAAKSTDTWLLLKFRPSCLLEKKVPAAILQRALPRAPIWSEKLPGLHSCLPVSVHSPSLSSPYSWPICREITVNSTALVKKQPNSTARMHMQRWFPDSGGRPIIRPP